MIQPVIRSSPSPPAEKRKNPSDDDYKGRAEGNEEVFRQIGSSLKYYALQVQEWFKKRNDLAVSQKKAQIEDCLKKPGEEEKVTCVLDMMRHTPARFHYNKPD